MDLLPDDWRAAMRPHLEPATVRGLSEFVDHEYATQQVFPPLPDLFAAFRLCPLQSARVLILGQDPYHRPGQAHGLSFSVRPGVPVPPSLRNIFKELHEDLGLPAPACGDLTPWASRGVLLLNSVLTVRAGKPAAHAGRGWEHLTDAAIRALDARPQRVVFLLWGAYARQKAALVTQARHVVLAAGHPSPMNQRGFRGTRPFSTCNAALVEAGEPEIAWSLEPAGIVGGSAT
ncbi:MAG TPA: uracil-DNA glycosylase [Micromonosporaceae bacterium]